MLIQGYELITIVAFHSLLAKDLEDNMSTILDINRRKLILRANLTYDRSVSHSEEGLPIGNGQMGSLVWGAFISWGRGDTTEINFG